MEKSDKAFNIPLGYEANSIINLKIEYLKNSENNFDVKMYIDGKMLYSTKTDATIRNVERSYLHMLEVEIMNHILMEVKYMI